MDAAPTQIQIIDRRLVIRPAGDRTHEQELIQHELPMVDIPFGEAVGSFKIKRRDEVRVRD